MYYSSSALIDIWILELSSQEYYIQHVCGWNIFFRSTGRGVSISLRERERERERELNPSSGVWRYFFACLCHQHFSAMRLLKTFLRSTMCSEILSPLALLHIYTEMILIKSYPSLCPVAKQIILKIFQFVMQAWHLVRNIFRYYFIKKSMLAI